MSAYGLGDTNLFVYCRDNRVKNSDDGGEWVHILVGAVIGCATGAISAAVSGGDKTDIAIAAATGAVSC